MYNSKILEIFKTPTNAGGLQGANGLGKFIDEECGDCVKIYLKINERGIVEEARFKAIGSVGTIVASSVICSLVADMNVEEAKTLSKQDVISVTGEYPQDKFYTINFALKALLLAIEDYTKKLEETDEPKKRGRKPKGEPKLETNLFSALDIDDSAKESKEQELVEPEDTFDEDIEEDYDFGYDAHELKNPQTTTTKEEFIEEESKDDGETQNNDTYYDDFEDELLFGEFDAFKLTNKQTKETKKQNAKKAKDISEELDGLKATKILEESKSYVPVIETKIISDEELAKKEPKSEIKEEKSESGKSSAKALFDSMFED